MVTSGKLCCCRAKASSHAMDDSRSSTPKDKCCRCCSRSTCRGIVAEFFCMFLFMFIAGTTDLAWPDRTVPGELHLALTLGFAVITLTQCFDAISGAHLNPMVTLGFIVTRQIGVIKGIMYLIVQFSGAFTAVLLLQGAIPAELQGALGSTHPSDLITPHLAFGVELLLTFIYVFTVLSSWELRTPNDKYFWPCCRSIVVGVTYSMNTLWGYAFTQASMNPARSIAASVIDDRTAIHWPQLLEVYCAGPVLGSISSSLIYKYIFATTGVGSSGDGEQNERGSTLDSSEEENMVALQSISSPTGRMKNTGDL